jgi:hypothetical protein
MIWDETLRTHIPYHLAKLYEIASPKSGFSVKPGALGLKSIYENGAIQIPPFVRGARGDSLAMINTLALE